MITMLNAAANRQRQADSHLPRAALQRDQAPPPHQRHCLLFALELALEPLLLLLVSWLQAALVAENSDASFRRPAQQALVQPEPLPG